MQIGYNLKKKKRKQSRINRLIEIPQEISTNLPKITVIGFKQMLIENYKGAFPTWLAPVQVKILTISDKQKEYADELLQHTEEVLTTTLGNLEKNVAEALKLMEISLEDTIKTVQNSRKELK